MDGLGTIVMTCLVVPAMIGAFFGSVWVFVTIALLMFTVLFISMFF